MRWRRPSGDEEPAVPTSSASLPVVRPSAPLTEEPTAEQPEEEPEEPAVPRRSEPSLFTDSVDGDDSIDDSDDSDDRLRSIVDWDEVPEVRPDDATGVGRVEPEPAVALDAGEQVRARRRAVARALAEDLGDAGDVTTAATVPPGARGVAHVVARADGVVAGGAVLGEVFEQVGPGVTVDVRVQDGQRVTRGDVVAEIEGPLRSLLTGERVALNFVCHLSGIATQTRRFVDAVDGLPVELRDTRKTTPGLRLLEKAAVVAGGGANHRVGLYDALLVKDNHVLAAGGVGPAARRAVERARGRHVQVEVTRLDQLDEVLAAGVDDILLDNFTPAEVRMAVRRVAGRATLEASGNVTLETVREYAETGVDRVAVGALTHSAPWLDLAMDVQGPARHDPDGEDSPPSWFDATPARTAVADGEDS